MTEEHDTYPEGAFGWAVSRPDVTNYAYRCYAFVEDAYELSSNIVLDGQGTSAAEAAEALWGPRLPRRTASARCIRLLRLLRSHQG